MQTFRKRRAGLSATAGLSCTLWIGCTLCYVAEAKMTHARFIDSSKGCYCLFFVVVAVEWRCISVRRRIAMHICRTTRWSGVAWPAWRDWKTTRAFSNTLFRARTNCFKSCLQVSMKSSADLLSPAIRIRCLNRVSCWQPTFWYAEPHSLYGELGRKLHLAVQLL